MAAAFPGRTYALEYPKPAVGCFVGDIQQFFQIFYRHKAFLSNDRIHPDSPAPPPVCRFCNDNPCIR